MGPRPKHRLRRHRHCAGSHVGKGNRLLAWSQCRLFVFPVALRSQNVRLMDDRQVPVGEKDLRGKISIARAKQGDRVDPKRPFKRTVTQPAHASGARIQSEKTIVAARGFNHDRGRRAFAAWQHAQDLWRGRWVLDRLQPKRLVRLVQSERHHLVIVGHQDLVGAVAVSVQGPDAEFSFGIGRRGQRRLQFRLARVIDNNHLSPCPQTPQVQAGPAGRCFGLQQQRPGTIFHVR